MSVVGKAGADVLEAEQSAIRGTKGHSADLPFGVLADTLPNQVWSAGPDGQLDWFNRRVYEYSGAAEGSLDGSNWASIVHPDDLAIAGPRWLEAIATGEGYETEFRLRDRHGAYRWHLARAVPIHDASGRLTRWIGTNTDIHDQRAAAEALAASESRLNLAIDAGHLAVWELDLATNEVAPSPALNRLYGFPPEARPTIDELRARYAPGEAERVALLGAEIAARGGTEIETEIRHLFPDGSVKWLLVRARMEQGTGKAAPRVIGVVIDVTAGRLVEEKLLRSEQRLRLSQQAAGIASLELDIQSGTVIGSDNFWPLWGLSHRESVNIATLEQIVIPEDKDIRSNPQTRREGTAVPNVEYRIRRPDNGEVRWLSRHIEFVHDAEGRPIKMFGVMQDITDRKTVEARQQMLTHELEHRIKNILATVSAIASQTLKNTDIDSARKGLIERINALASAHDLLGKTRWTDTTLRDVVDVTLAAHDPQRIVVRGPHLQLAPRQALTLALAVNELATNAVKYGALSTPNGTVEVSWAILGASAGRPVRLAWTWRESGGPPVAAPDRRGFGSFLIERVLAADFGGTAHLDYAADGLVCELEAPVPGAQFPVREAP